MKCDTLINILFAQQVWFTDWSAQLSENCGLWKSFSFVQCRRLVHSDRDKTDSEHWGGSGHCCGQLPPRRGNIPVHPRELHQRPQQRPGPGDSAHAGAADVRPGQGVPVREDRAESEWGGGHWPQHVSGAGSGGCSCERGVWEGAGGHITASSQGLCSLPVGQSGPGQERTLQSSGKLLCCHRSHWQQVKLISWRWWSSILILSVADILILIRKPLKLFSIFTTSDQRRLDQEQWDHHYHQLRRRSLL